MCRLVLGECDLGSSLSFVIGLSPPFTCLVSFTCVVCTISKKKSYYIWRGATTLSPTIIRLHHTTSFPFGILLLVFLWLFGGLFLFFYCLLLVDFLHKVQFENFFNLCWATKGWRLRWVDSSPFVSVRYVQESSNNQDDHVCVCPKQYPSNLWVLWNIKNKGKPWNVDWTLFGQHLVI